MFFIAIQRDFCLISLFLSLSYSLSLSLSLSLSFSLSISLSHTLPSISLLLSLTLSHTLSLSISSCHHLSLISNSQVMRVILGWHLTVMSNNILEVGLIGRILQVRTSLSFLFLLHFINFNGSVLH